jgi:hypothetical protein
LETDSQHCCRWVTPLDDGDDPVVYLVDPDDFTGETGTPHALSFTAYTEADVWDGHPCGTSGRDGALIPHCRARR